MPDWVRKLYRAEAERLCREQQVPMLLLEEAGEGGMLDADSGFSLPASYDSGDEEEHW